MLLLTVAAFGGVAWLLLSPPAAAPAAKPPSAAPQDGIATKPAASAAPRAEAAAPSEPKPARRKDATALPDRQHIADAATVHGTLFLRDAPLANATVTAWRIERSDPGERMESVTTDEHGAFVVKAFASVRSVITVEDPRVAMGTVLAELRNSSVAGADLGRLDVVEPARLSLRAVDESGRPVAGARVCIEANGWRALSPPRLLHLLGRDDRELPDRATDDDGRLTWERLPAGYARVLIDADGHAPTMRTVELVAGSELALGDQILSPGNTLQGRVVDHAGAAVAGARVAVQPRFGSGPTVQRTVDTDEHGAFTLTGLPSRGLELSVTHPEHPPLRVRPKPDEHFVVVQLERGFWITGHVVGATPEHVTLGFESVASGLASFSASWRRQRAEVAADGTFRIGPVVPGRYRLQAVAGGASPKTVVNVTDSDVAVDLRIDAQPGVAVVVRDPDGQPVADATVAWNDEAWPMKPVAATDDMTAATTLAAAQRDGTFATTDQQGRAHVAVDRTRPWLLVVQPAGGLRVARAFAADEAPDEIELTLPGAGRCTGHVLGVPNVPGLTVSVDAKPRDGRRSTAPWSRCGPDGAYDVGPLPTGRYTMEVYVSGSPFDRDATVQPHAMEGVLGEGTQQALSFEVEVGDGETVTHDVRLPEVGRISGRVSQRGEPVAGVWVFAVNADDAAERRRRPWGGGIDDDRPPIGAPVAVTDAEGRYVFHVLTPGSWQLHAHRRGTPVAAGPFPVTIGAAGVKVVLDLPLGGGHVEGTVDPDWLAHWDGHRHEALLFRADRVADDAFSMGMESLPATASMSGVELGPDGHFAFDAVPAGAYLVRFEEWLRPASLQVPVVVTEGENVDLGTLRAPEMHAIDLPVAGAANGSWIAIRQQLDPLPAPAWFTSGQVKDGHLHVSLPAGRYQLELQAASPPVYSGRPVGSGKTISLRISSDGACEPATLAFP